MFFVEILIKASTRCSTTSYVNLRIFNSVPVCPEIYFMYYVYCRARATICIIPAQITLARHSHEHTTTLATRVHSRSSYGRK